jgi:hypothetical protein
MIEWTETRHGAVVRFQRLGMLVVRRRAQLKARGAMPSYEVAVFGTALETDSPTLEDGKARAIHAARLWTKWALARLRPDPCPKAELIKGCDWPSCDCGEG